MKDLPVKDILGQFAPMAAPMLAGGPPIIKEFLDFFKENILADVGYMLHIPKLVYAGNFRTEGFKELYEIFIPE